MGYETARAAIAQKFADEWPSQDFPIVAENQPFPGGRQPSGPWARYSIRPAANITTVVDATSRQIVGLVWLTMFIPEMGGVRPATLMAEAMEEMFAEKRIVLSDGLLRFERAELAPDGVTTDGFSQWRCTVRYRDDANITP
jgi:hypothetical protein